jgi:hypothetical protein
MTPVQEYLIHEAATKETTADQFRNNLESWMLYRTLSEQENKERAIHLHHCFLMGTYNPKSGTLLLSPLPDEDDDYREARA